MYEWIHLKVSEAFNYIYTLTSDKYENDNFIKFLYYILSNAIKTEKFINLQ